MCSIVHCCAVGENSQDLPDLTMDFSFFPHGFDARISLIIDLHQRMSSQIGGEIDHTDNLELENVDDHKEFASRRRAMFLERPFRKGKTL